MAQTRDGARIVRARKAGITVAELIELEKAGQKFCYGCRTWKDRVDYQLDGTRGDGLACLCRECKGKRRRKPPETHRKSINPKTGKPGPEPRAFRDGDKMQARQQVALKVRNGEMPSAKELPCVWCSHVCDETAADHEHEYHHHRGYSAEHFLDVIPLCKACHGKATSEEYQRCRRGHVMEGNNVGITGEGRRFCCECRRIRDRARKRPDGYWKKVYAKRRGNHSTN